jgi:hypothetical protein
MIIIKEKQSLDEMARVCQKADGYGIVVDIYSRDHGKIGDTRLPAHAHLFDTSMKELGEFEITSKSPIKPSDVMWYRTPSPPSEGYALRIVKWAKGSKYGVNNWMFAIRTWEGFHPGR